MPHRYIQITRIRNNIKYFIIASFLLCLLLTGCTYDKSETEPMKSAHEDTAQSDLSEEELTTELVTTEAVENLKNEKVSIVMVGDMLLHTSVSESGKIADDIYNYDHLFTHVKDKIESADIAIVNEEVILGGRELGLSGYPCFNGAYEVGDALVKNGFDVILHATNHALDKGEKGIRNCLNFWQSNYPNIWVTGINGTQEDQDNNIVIINKKGIRIAILNYTYGTNGIDLPKAAPYLVNTLNKDKIEKDVKLAKDNKADYIIVCPHWGIEYQHNQSEEQMKWAKFFSSLGVDLVIGTHPHVIQPVEWIENEEGKKTLVYYSLGNFVNATSGVGDGVTDRMLGEMAMITIGFDEKNEIVVDSYDAYPIVSHVKSGVQNITVYPLEEYTDELALQNEIRQQDPNFSLGELQNVWKKGRISNEYGNKTGAGKNQKKGTEVLNNTPPEQ